MKFTWLLSLFMGDLSPSPLQEEDYSERYCHAYDPEDDENNRDI